MKQKHWFNTPLSIWTVVVLLLTDVSPPVMSPSTPEEPSVPAVGVLPAWASAPPANNSATPSAEPNRPSCPCALGASPHVGAVSLPPRTTLVGEMVAVEPGLSVNSGSGALMYDGVGLDVPNRGPAFGVSLSYHSLYRETDNGWGYGWEFDRDWRYHVEANDDVAILLGRGGLYFASDGQGGFVSQSESMTLTQQADALILTWSDGRQMYFESPAHKRITRWEDADDRALTFSYDGGDLEAIANDSGRQLTFSFDNGRLHTIADEESTPPRRLQLDYSPAGDLITMTNGLNQATVLSYDDEHRLTGVTGPQGGETIITYEGDYVAQVERGRLTRTFIPNEASYTITMREEDDTGTVRDHVSVYDYMGLLESVTYPGGASRTQKWDDVQNQQSTTDENGHTTVMLYDEKNNLTATRDPLGHTTTYTYHPTLGYLVGETDPNGYTSTFEYSDAGEMKEMIDPLGHRQSFSYNSYGDVMAITDALLHTIGLGYDENGMLATITNPLGIPTAMGYDLAGNLTSITDGNGHVTRYAYDALGQPVVITDALGHTSAMAYDESGNLVHETDPNGHVTRYAHDELDHLTVITDALGGELRLAYDAWRNPTALTDVEGRTTRYTYDARDRMRSHTDPLSQTAFYRYDGVGNRVGLTGARGQVISYTYDAADRLTAVDYPGDDDTYYLYDPAGQMIALGDADVDIGHTYDAAGRITRTVYAYDGVGFAPLELAYSYDAADRLSGVTLPGGEVVSREYDAADRLTALTWSGTRYELAYDDGNRLTGIAPAAGQPGIRTDFDYDAANRLTVLTNASPGQVVTFDTFDHDYDPAGNVLTTTHDGETTGYTYDALHRLTDVTFPDGNWEHYAYDGVGNRLQLESPAGVVSYAYDGADQLLVMTDTLGGPPVVTTFTYDENGNLRSRATQGQTTTYTWDAADRLVRIDYPDGTYTAYTYGPEGRRLSRRNRAGETVYYVYDGLNLVEERDAAGNLLAGYVYGEELDRPYSIRRGGQTYYYLYDRLGSVIGLTGGAGNVVARYEYDAWGNILSESGTVENPFRYAGREWDAEAGLYYNRARYYDPALGRFLSRDPLGPVDGTNRYVYVSNNPVNYADPLGTSRLNNDDDKCNFCQCFNTCFKEAYISGVKDMILKITYFRVVCVGILATRRTPRTGDPRKGIGKDILFTICLHLIMLEALIPKAHLLGTNDCLATARMLDYEFSAILFGLAASVSGGVKGLAIGLAATIARGGGCLACIGVCTASATLDCKDKIDPTVKVEEVSCDQYRVTATDNCELAVDPSGDYSAESEPRTLPPAQDEEGNTSDAITIPACKEECKAEPDCEPCEHPKWKQEACDYECVENPRPDPPECPNCYDLRWNDETCEWECKKRPQPPMPNCGVDKCGRMLLPVWNSESCSWRCQGGTNNPCKPDDNRSLAGLETPAWINLQVGPSAPASSPAMEDEYPPASIEGLAEEARGRIAILDNGFSISLQDFLALQGVSADRVPADFSPEMVDRYPVLFIPSGGLSGYATSELMRQRLEQYAANGGVIIAFTQEYGEEFRLLPGGSVGGYGYDEDMNCHSNSAQIATFAPMLLGQSDEVLSLNVDGFFTHWPTDTVVLLNRIANGMPAMLTYPYEAGRVVATTAYADMAYYQGQWTYNERILLRDLARWALAPELSVDSYGPHDVVTAVLTITNQTVSPVVQLRHDLFDPWGRLAASDSLTLPVPLDPGDITQVTLTLDLDALALPEADRYGLWSVDATLSDGAGSAVQEMPDAYRFAVTHFTEQAGGGHGYRGKPYALSVTSASEEYPYGSSPIFTYNVFNHSDQDETFRVTWIMLHHAWYGLHGSQGSETITVAAHSMGMFTSVLERVADLDLVRVRLYLNDQQVAYADRGFWAVHAALSQNITTDKEEYYQRETPVVTVTTSSDYSLSMPIQTTAHLMAWAPDGQTILTDTRTFIVTPGPSHVYTITLPPLTQAGYYEVSVNTEANDHYALWSSARFYLPPLRANIAPGLPTKLAPGVSVTLTTTNVGAGALPAATLQVSLTNPAGATVWSDESALPALEPGQAATRTFALSDIGAITLGDYALVYRVLNAGELVGWGETILPARPALEGAFDQPFYHIRDTVLFTTTLRNAGRFDLTPLVTITVPGPGVTKTQAVTLPVGGEATLPLTFTLPVSLPSGTYTVTTVVAQGTTMTRSFSFVVPPANLVADLVPGFYHAGEALTVTLTNVGGVDALVTYTLTLRDPEVEFLLSESLSDTLVLAGTMMVVSGTILAEAMSGNYVLRMNGVYTPGNQPLHLYRLVNVSGVAGEVAVRTDRESYLSGENILAVGHVTATQETVSGTLDLRVVSAMSSQAENERVNAIHEVGESSQYYPAIATDANGNAYAVWRDDRNPPPSGTGHGDIYFAYRPVTGTWSANVRVNDDGDLATQDYPSIAVDANGNAYAVWVDERDGNEDIYFAYRPVTGTWSANVRVNDDGGTARQDDPAIAVDADGNAYAVWKDYRSDSRGDIYFAYRPVVTGTWSANVQINDDITGTATQATPSIAVDADGNAYAVWYDRRSDSNGDIYFASRPVTGTWGTNELVNDDAGTARQRYPAIAVEADGSAYVAWLDRRSGDYDIYFATRPVTGTWSANVQVNDTPGSAAPTNPAIAVDVDGNAYAMWGDNRDGNNDDIYFAYRPVTETWGANVLVNDDGITASWARQSDPAIVVDADGNAYAAWMDYRYGDTGGDIYFATLTVTGTWSANVRVNDDTGGREHEDPAVAVDADGNAHVVWEFEPGHNRLADIVSNFRPANGTWEGEVIVSDDGEAQWIANPEIALDADGNAYAVWGDIYFSYRPVTGTTWSANECIDDSGDIADTDIAVDADGNAYAVWSSRLGSYYRGIFFAYRPVTGTWSTRERIDYTGDPTPDFVYPAIAVDAFGNVYVVWTGTLDNNIYFGYRPAGGEWNASELINDEPDLGDRPDIAVDLEGNAYAVWEDRRNEGNEHDIYFAYRPAGGTWGENVRVNDDTLGGNVEQLDPAIAVDADGNAYAVWEDRRNGDSIFDIYFAYRPAWGTWEANVRVNDDQTAGTDREQPSIGVDDYGNAYIVWGDWRKGDPDIYFAILSVSDEKPLWRQNVPVHTATTQAISETVGTLDEQPGKYWLLADLRSEIPQTLSQSRYPFYIFPFGTALTLETDRPIYRPGQVVTVSGRVTNTDVQAATIPLTVTAGEETLLTRTLTLAPDEGAPYSTTFTAADNVLLIATAGPAEAAEWVRVVAPQVEATLEAPEVAGRAPFSATLMVTNTGEIAVALTADFAGQVTHTVTLESGDLTLLHASLAITEDTVLTATLSGDVALTLTQAIIQGEIVTLALGAPAGVVWAELTALPYTLTNSGLLPSTLPLTFTLNGTDVLTRLVATLPGEAYPGELWLDLSPGAYYLTATTPYQAVYADWIAHEPGEMDVTIDTLDAPAYLVGRTPVTTTLTNRGLGPVAGTLLWQTPFDLAETPFDLEPGETQSLTATLDSDGAPAGGTYTLTVEAWTNGTLLDQASTSLDVPATGWRVTMDDLVLVPGVETMASFDVRNVGGIGAPFTLTLDLLGLYRREKLGWAGPGESVSVTFAISVPADLDARTGMGRYLLNGIETPFTYTIAGYQLDMRGRLTPRVAEEGQLVTATVWVTDVSGLGQPIPLWVRLAGVGEPQTTTVTLDNSATATFLLTAPERSALLSYGLYHPDGRSLLLDTLRLYVLGDLIGVYPDRTLYQAGETVQMTALAQVTGTLTWYAFGISGTLSLIPETPGGFAVPLAGDLIAGSYHVMYLFEATDGEWEQDEVTFEVEGYHVEVRRVVLYRQVIDDQEQVSATLRVKSTPALDDVAITGEVLAPDGTALVSGTTTVDLPAGHSWVSLPPLTFSSDQAGIHRLAYRLSQGGRELASGLQAFDVAGAVMLGVNVPRAYYLPSQPVTASVALLNEGTPPATLTVTLDGQPVTERIISAAGYRVEPLDLGLLSVGVYTLSATLVDSVGHTSQGAAEIRVVPNGVQLLVSPPNGLDGWHVTTPTVGLWPEVEESTVYYSWDGGVPQPAVNHQAEIPADGRHDLAAWAELPDGSVGPVVTATVWLDRVRPEMEVTIEQGRPITLSLAVLDDTSGVDWVGTWAGDDWLTYTVPLTFTSAQTTTVLYRVRDQAGNSSAGVVEAPPVDQVYVYGLQLDADTYSLEGPPGAAVAYTLRVTNTGVTADTYTVTVAGDAWPARGPVTLGPVDAGRVANLVAVVDIPPEAVTGESDVAAVTVTSLGNPAQSEERQLTTMANVAHGVQMEAARTARTGAPGGQVIYRLRVTNLGNVADTFDVTVAGNAWPANAPATVGPLAAGASEYIEVVVSISADAEAGESDIAAVTVTSQGDPVQSAALDLTTRATAPVGDLPHRIYLPLVLRSNPP